jgi:hypothetical protein
MLKYVVREKCIYRRIKLFKQLREYHSDILREPVVVSNTPASLKRALAADSHLSEGQFLHEEQELNKEKSQIYRAGNRTPTVPSSNNKLIELGCCSECSNWLVAGRWRPSFDRKIYFLLQPRPILLWGVLSFIFSGYRKNLSPIYSGLSPPGAFTVNHIG